MLASRNIGYNGKDRVGIWIKLRRCGRCVSVGIGILISIILAPLLLTRPRIRTPSAPSMPLTHRRLSSQILLGASYNPRPPPLPTNSTQPILGNFFIHAHLLHTTNNKRIRRRTSRRRGSHHGPLRQGRHRSIRRRAQPGNARRFRRPPHRKMAWSYRAHGALNQIPQSFCSLLIKKQFLPYFFDTPFCQHFTDQCLNTQLIIYKYLTLYHYKSPTIAIDIIKFWQIA